MAKYLLLWEVDYSRTPEDLATRKQQWLSLQTAVTKQMEAGRISDWGLFVGEGKGYCIVEGSAEDVGTVTHIYTPFVHFEVKQVVTIQEAMENLEGVQEA
jgi:hypothetical protein